MDAIFNAIKLAVGSQPHLVLYAVDGVDRRHRRTGQCPCAPRANGRIASGNAAEPDTLVASARAYLNAVNRLMIERGAWAQARWKAPQAGGVTLYPPIASAHKLRGGEPRSATGSVSTPSASPRWRRKRLGLAFARHGHSIHNDEAVERHFLAAMNGGPAELVVRIPSIDPALVKRLIDGGVLELHVPFVQTVEEAKLAVASTRYPPEGFAAFPAPRGPAAGAGQVLASRPMRTTFASSFRSRRRRPSPTSQRAGPLTASMRC